MGIRESIDRQKKWVAVGTIALILVLAVIGSRSAATSPGASTAPAQSFYTVDDGAHWFTALADQIPPFDYQGKTACRAVLFTCDGGKTRFVGYLERYTPAAKKQLEATRQATARKDGGPAPSLASAQAGVEVKKPGADKKWVSRTNPAAGEVLHVTCPTGGGTPELVTP